MRKMKKGVALALTATMVLGSTVTAFAADANSGSTTGSGTSEGHVDKHVINVELPTVAEGSTPFAYTMDAERLIQETGGAKYEDAVFPIKDSDTGIYFLTGQNDDGKNTYANTSEELKVTSKSSADVKLTVEVTADSKDTDIALVDAEPADDATDPQLYLALKVGSTTKAIKKGETAKAEVTIAGKDDNFETTVNDEKKYVYTEKKVEDGGEALTWNGESISLTGAVSKASAKDLTAPELTVTWKYEDPAAAPTEAAPSIATTSYNMEADTDIEIPVDLGTGDLKATGVSSIKWGAVDLVSKSYATYADNTVTIKANCVNVLLNKPDSSQTITITFDDAASTVKTVTLNK